MKDIEAYAFEDCTSLKTIKFENIINFPAIYENTFKGCNSLASFPTPDSVKTINNRAFEGCSSLKQITTKTLTNIGDSVFKGCSSLADVIDLSHDSFTNLGTSAFESCSSISGVKLSKNLKSFGNYAFKG